MHVVYLFSRLDPSTYVESCHIKFVTISTALSCDTFLLLYRVVPTFEFWDEFSDHSNGSY